MTELPDNQWDRDSFDWPHLPAQPVILEVGGFEGRWLAEMARRYGGDLYAFEPQEWANKRIYERVRDAIGPEGRATITVVPYGLGEQDATMQMGGWGTDACSFLLDDAFYARFPDEGRRDRGEGRIREVGAALAELGIEHVDVMMVNIEGYEYRLLPLLLSSGMIERIRYISVQFHRAHDPDGSIERGIFRRMSDTHDLLWAYPDGVLAAWERRP